MKSPSSRGRGLKYPNVPQDLSEVHVALFTRAWIEINQTISQIGKTKVALFTRAWIEIFLLNFMLSQDNCRPLHEGVD